MSHILRLQSRVFTSQFLARSEMTLLDCKRNLLSSTLVPEHTLKADVAALALNISRRGYELSIPSKFINKYFSLPLTTCTFSPEKVVVTVKIPIRKKGHDFSIFEYIPSPLAWGEYTCSLSREPVYVATAGDLLTTITGLQRNDCDVRSTGLCRIPRQTQGSSLSTECARRILRGDPMESLRTVCHFSCYPSHQNVLVTQISESSYMVTNPTPSLLLNCPNNSISFPYRVPGAVEVEVPCDCSVADKDREYIPVQFPCFSTSRNPELTHVLPLTWTSLKNLSVPILSFDERPKFGNLTEVLNSNWNLSVPTMLIHNNINSESLEPVELPKSWLDVTEVCSLKYILVFGWLGILSFLSLFCTFKLYILNLKLRLLSEPGGLPPRLPPRGLPRPITS